MAKARALDKRRRSIRNIRKITRTMELIATARFKKAMDRAQAATAFTRKITELVADLARAGLSVSHPLLVGREETKKTRLLVLTANRGLCGGYNSGVIRASLARQGELAATVGEPALEVSGKRGISAFRFKGLKLEHTYTHFEDKPKFDEVEVLANRYLEAYTRGELDRLDVAYCKFLSASRQSAVVETILPLGSLAGAEEKGKESEAPGHGATQYEFLPTAQSILEEVVPASFKVRLFKCFLDAAVSEQIARRVAMKSATENADDLIKSLGMSYNRARQSQITSEILEIIGGAEALNK
jgi:F-type H+-transporting ATPase subunit gamma